MDDASFVRATISGQLRIGKMLLHAGRFLAEFVYPFNFALMLLALAVVLIWRGRTKAAGRIVVVAMLFLILPSTPIVANPCMSMLENVYPNLSLEETPSADVIVVLGGSVSQVIAPRLLPEEQIEARIMHAYRLYKAGKAPLILCSDGSRYEAFDGKMRKGADDMRYLLVEMGVPEDSILLEKTSRNTYENAKKTADILREKQLNRVLLVTSAMHMPRAAALFREQGVDITPVPNSHRMFHAPWSIRDCFPHLPTLWQSTMAIKEVIGYVVYWVLGRI
ncbi:MAG: YdcF family protein [Planctomycetota bacterium]